MEIPWLEKYRPKTLDDIVGNEEAIKRLKVLAVQGNMPNLILAGPPGTGKTSSVLALAKQLLGGTYNSGVLELNASDERGIDVVRNKIKMFAQRKVSLPPGRHKIIILDEGDSMTQGAQQALRRIMEMYSSSTRFAIACNTSSKIIEAIQSRCAILRYTRLSNDQILQRIMYVMNQEKLSAYTSAGLEAILFTSDGDLRSAMNNLQATFAGFQSITPENVYRVCDQPDPVTAVKILDMCLEGKTKASVLLLKGLWDSGHVPSHLISTLFRVSKTHQMPENIRLKFIKSIAKTNLRMSQGLNTFVQLSGLIADLSTISLSSKSPA